MNKLNISKRHHYAPEWYLKRFADLESGKLVVYDRKNNDFRENQNPDKVMTIKHHNRQEWVPEGVNPLVFEDAIEIVENRGRIAIDALIENPLRITEDDTAAIIVYLLAQRIRVPRQANIAMQSVFKPILNEFISKNSDIAEALIKENFEITLKDKECRFEYMASIGEPHIDYFVRMQGEVYTAADGASFITTDNPVTFFNPAFYPLLEPGIAYAGTMVFFPLSPKQLLVLKHPEIDRSPTIDPLTTIVADPLPEEGHQFVKMVKEIEAQMVWSINKMMIDLADNIVVAAHRTIIENSLIH